MEWNSIILRCHEHGIVIKIIPKLVNIRRVGNGVGVLEMTGVGGDHGSVVVIGVNRLSKIFIFKKYYNSNTTANYLTDTLDRLIAKNWFFFLFKHLRTSLL